MIAPGWRTEGMEMTAKGYRVFLGGGEGDENVPELTVMMIA